MIKAGGMNFSTKAKLRNKCKYILNSTINGEDLSEKDYSIIDDVFKMHTNYEHKTKGLSYVIKTRPCSTNPRKYSEFYITRSDGSTTDFSYHKCLITPSNTTKVKKSLRSVVNSQVWGYKNQYFKDNQDSKGYVICPVTKLKIRTRDSHIDHYPKTFNTIVEEWVKLECLDIKTIKVKPSGDNTQDELLEDDSLCDSFYRYHESVAEYRIVLDKVNLQRKRS